MPRSAVHLFPFHVENKTGPTCKTYHDMLVRNGTISPYINRRDEDEAKQATSLEHSEFNNILETMRGK